LKVLVYPHALEIGGSQLNAIEIAAAVRDLGHEVLVVSEPGPLVETMRRLGLSHVQLDTRAKHRPSPHAAAQLVRLARQHGIDVVHGYEWPPAVEAFAGPWLRLGLPVVFTVNSDYVAPFLPRTVPLVVCTDDSRIRAEKAGHGAVTVIETPVDVRTNAPDYDPGTFRSGLGFRAGLPLVAMICRLATELKLEGLLAACDAVAELAVSGVPLQLAIVGDGPARPLIEQAAAAANARAGHRIVALAGQLADPRPAYAAADVVLGMGGSALRGLAFGKPLVVQGERGFWELLTPESAPRFYGRAWYGLGAEGDGRAAGARRLASILRALLDDPAARDRLGRFGRSVVVQRFSLERAAVMQEGVYLDAIAASRPSALDLTTDAARTGIGVFRHKTARKWQRWRGTCLVDDFTVDRRVWLTLRDGNKRSPAAETRF
jgi:glycosyltransferase involved in cell wall biosynthesis